MSTTTTGPTLEARILREGYGPGAWHGADMKAALADVGAGLAFWRPGPGRHNIAEIALHHAYTVRGVGARLSGAAAPPFVIEGDDWFDLADASRLSWPAVRDTVEREQAALTGIVDAIQAGRVRSPLAESERLDLVLGITCHAAYHAGQVQILKRLHVGQ